METRARVQPALGRGGRSRRVVFEVKRNNCGWNCDRNGLEKKLVEVKGEWKRFGSPWNALGPSDCHGSRVRPRRLLKAEIF